MEIVHWEPSRSMASTMLENIKEGLRWNMLGFLQITKVKDDTNRHRQIQRDKNK